MGYLLACSSGGNGSTEEGGASASEPGALAAAEAELARLRTQLRDAGAQEGWLVRSNTTACCRAWMHHEVDMTSRP